MENKIKKNKPIKKVEDSFENTGLFAIMLFMLLFNDSLSKFEISLLEQRISKLEGQVDVLKRGK